MNNLTDIPKRLLTLDELVQYTGLDKGTLYNWTSQKKIPYVKISRLLRFDIRKIDEWIESKTIDNKNSKNIFIEK